VSAEREEDRLVARARAGDLVAYETLVGRNGDRVYTAILRVVGNTADAEDIVQETLLRGWRGIGRFRGGARFSTWIHRIALNETNRFFARGANRRRAQAPIADEVLADAPEAGPAARAELHELEEELRAAVAGLPPKLRSALVLRDIEGLSTREAAGVVGVREAAFKSRLHQARGRVRATLGDRALVAASTVSAPDGSEEAP